MKWFRDYVLHANWKTPWGLYSASKASGKLLAEIPGYNEIYHEQKRLAFPFFAYMGIFIILYYIAITLLSPITVSVTEFCYSGDVVVECPDFKEPKDGLCDIGKILTNRDNDWWCVDPNDQQLGIITDNEQLEYVGNPIIDEGCHLIERSNLGDLYKC